MLVQLAQCPFTMGYFKMDLSKSRLCLHILRHPTGKGKKQGLERCPGIDGQEEPVSLDRVFQIAVEAFTCCQ